MQTVINCRHLTHTPNWPIRAAELSWGNAALDLRHDDPEAASRAAIRAATTIAASHSPWLTFNRIQRGRPARDKNGLAEHMIRVALRHILTPTNSHDFAAAA